MNENSKKRANSFRKLFPHIFFSHKSKEKSNKDSRNLKAGTEDSLNSNQYHDPQAVIPKSSRVTEGDDENIYENLTIPQRKQTISEIPSNHSSSSTLVSESVKNKPFANSDDNEIVNYRENDYTEYSARPQVPRRPQNEVMSTKPNKQNVNDTHYPDVYYHSLEKLTDKITPLDEIDIYRASKVQANPAPVSAEIKKVSTKFLISPKKEAEVRTIQPNRARSLSLDKNNERSRSRYRDGNENLMESNTRKPYNYSAPTSPMPVSHKIPHMPKTVSPYEHIRKTMIEAEEKRNSLSRSSNLHKSTPSPRPSDYSETKQMRASKENIKQEEVAVDKERTRQKVEAFYWQKLKEQKQKEDELLLRQSIHSPIRNHSLYGTTYSNSCCSTPNSFSVEPRSYSLPRGKDLSSYVINQPIYAASPFIRNAPERRTDTYIKSRDSYTDQDFITYRHPEKLLVKNSIAPMMVVQDQKPMPIFQRGSLTRDARDNNQQPKRVSFEEQYLNKTTVDSEGTIKKVGTNLTECEKTIKSRTECSPNALRIVGNGSKGPLTVPPRPPIRTTSVSSMTKNEKAIYNRKQSNLSPTGQFIYSESESGSEAGEIQRILQNNTRKEEDWHGDGSRMDDEEIPDGWPLSANYVPSPDESSGDEAGGYPLRTYSDHILYPYRYSRGLSDGEANRSSSRGRTSRRDDPRRHTLAGNHFYIHPGHAGQINTLDLEQRRLQPKIMNTPEYAIVTKYRDPRKNNVVNLLAKKPPLPRSYPPPNALLFDDDPGIMSEVETASTGFRRGGKQRSSLPVVRTPSKTLERPLGLVFLQYRNETKRALLPNEITSIDTVKALFVRSFPKQLTMQYMDSPLVKIYIHDSSKDMFYELEDDRAHLRDIRDRSVLRLFEATDIGGGAFPGAVGVGSVAMPAGAATCSGPSSWDQEQSYFSEPEIDSEYHHQHVHKSKVKAPAYYIGNQAPSTLPRGGSMLRAFSPAAPPVPADRVKTLPGAGPPAPAKPLRTYLPGSGSERCFPFAAECPRGDQLYTIPDGAGHAGEGYMSSPERGAARAPYEDPYYTQYLGPAAARATITPVIDEEAGDGVIIDDAYQMYGVNAITTAPRPMPRPPYDARLNTQVDDMQRLRVEKMERQLANLTGLVQKALQVPAPSPTPAVAPRQEFPTFPARPPPQDAARFGSNERPPKLGRDKFQKSVSFEKSVSFSDDPPDMNSPKQHSPQHSADSKPTKPAIKSSTLPRTSSQERDRLKPAPPPKPAGLVGQQMTLVSQRTYTINVTPDFFSQLRTLQKQSRDLRIETRNLRRSTLAHAIQMRQLMAETIVKIGAIAASFCEQDPDSQLTREEEIYRQDMLLLENDLYELEATVERLRGQAANRETRVNMADIERIAMVLSKSSKTVADWKLKFPILQETMKVKLAAEMEKVVRKEKMLEEEPERLELALRRCKKLTGTLVTLKRLACVQEQRLPLADGRISPGSSQSSTTFTAGPSSDEFNSDSTCHIPQAPHNKGSAGCGRGAARGAADVRPENALDALLDELQTFAKPAERAREPPLRRLHSYPSGSDTDASPPVRARGQHAAKPPVPERHPELLALAARRAPPPPPPRTTSRSPLASPTSPASPDPDDPDDDRSAARQALLEQRHQELLKKQKALQEQYARLQMIQRSGPTLPPAAQPDLKKTGSESNLLTKMNLNLAPAALSGSMTHLAGEGCAPDQPDDLAKPADAVSTTNKVYETDIL